jgi:hypothetical protein
VINRCDGATHLELKTGNHSPQRGATSLDSVATNQRPTGSNRLILASAPEPSLLDLRSGLSKKAVHVRLHALLVFVRPVSAGF